MRTRFTRTVKRTLLTTAVAAAAFGTAVPSATATDSSGTSGPSLRVNEGVGTLAKGDCPSGTLCLWDNTNFGNANGWVSITPATGHWALPAEWRNRAGSVFNNTNRTVYLHDDACTSEVIFLPAGTSRDELNDWPRACGGTWNNKVDTVEFR